MARTPEEQNGLRRVPSQGRGHDRVEAILDAAAEAFAELGVDQTTMESIATRSGSAIGSVYQFFPNKKVLFRKVVERSLERSQAVFAQMMPTELAHDEWPAMLDLIVDGYAAFEHTDPGFRAIWSNLHFHGEFLYDENALYDLLVGRTQKLLTQLAPDLEHSHACVIATMLVEMVNAAIVITSRKDPSLSAKMLSETKVMLRHYLSAYIPPTK